MLFIQRCRLIIISSLLSLAAQAETPLQTVPSTLETVRYEQMFDGVVEAIRQSTVAAQVTGRITEVNFDVDDLVEKNAVLIRIHDKEYRARLKQAEASLAEARARLKDATSEFKRIEGLFKEKVVSAAEFDKANAGLKSARARVNAAEGQVAEAQEQLDNTLIRAPYSGVVVKRHVEPGETVSAGQPVMTGFSLEQLRVNVDVPQAYINAVRQYQSASVYPANGTGALPVKDLTVFPYADPTTHTFRVRVELAPGIQGLYPGMLVKAGFVVDERKQLLVPSSAIVNRVEVEALYVVGADGEISMRQIRTGRVYADKTAVLAGVDEGEEIALDPLRAGALLKERMGAK